MIKFTDRQWDRVIENYRLWRKGELGRPILPCVFWGADPDRSEPPYKPLCFENCADFSFTPAQIIDRADYNLSCLEFAGDSYPNFWVNFGAGVLAAFLGAELHSTKETVWFHPKKILPLKELHFEYNSGNVWFNRIQAIYEAGMKKWRGQVVLGMTDLGGVLDVLASLRTTENLLTDLLDEPDEVLRLVKEIHGIWFQYYGVFNQILQGQRGYTDWAGIYSERPSYMLQCDFSYMISPEMFSEFVMWELEDAAKRLPNAFYHLDGVGQLPHLPQLLRSENITGIQWVPGDGEPVTRDWSGVYKQISEAGKKIQAFYGLDSYLDEILQVIKRPDDLVKGTFGYPIARRTEIMKRLAAYGAD
ncbi:MAG: hypothetical protein FWE62_03725 [Firmicutes bacterium]|nr:hypothetical protein [Bacillota bacterium]